jgi:hypothetical protein
MVTFIKAVPRGDSILQSSLLFANTVVERMAGSFVLQALYLHGCPLANIRPVTGLTIIYTDTHAMVFGQRGKIGVR